MNVLPLPIAHRPTAAPHPAAGEREAAAQARETLVQRSAALARQLADVMLANVQNTASLNLNAARALLAHARIPAPTAQEPRTETWRHSWRSYEVCVTSADQILNLTRGHVERTTSALWRATEQAVDDMQHLQARQVDELRHAFNAMRDAQAAYWQAAQQVHHELIALVHAPLPPTLPEADAGTH